MSYRNLSHAKVFTIGGLLSGTIDLGVAISGGVLVSKVVHHFGIKLLDALRLATAGVAATAATRSTGATATSAVGGLGGSSGLGLGLLTMME